MTRAVTSAGATVDVTLQYFGGCPNWQLALHRIRLAAHEIGVSVRVRTVLVEAQQDADRLGFAGSPTILLDGRDPFASPGAAPALVCRVYDTPGGLAGVPSLEQIVLALHEWGAGRVPQAPHQRAP
jgi:hypothetical protein